MAQPTSTPFGPRSGIDRMAERPWYVRFGGVLVLPLGVLTYLAVLWVMLDTGNPVLFPTLLLIGALTVPLAVLLLAYTLGRRPDGHAGLVAMTALAGGAFGTTSAGLLEYNTLRTMPGLGMLAVGAIEEGVKLVVPVLVFLFVRRRTEGLGIVLGIASGLGFAVLETMGYGFAELIASHGNIEVVDRTLLLRALLSPAGHVAWTGMVGAALWRARSTPPKRFILPGFLGALVLAIVLHTLWDATTNLWAHIALAAISVAILVGLIIRNHLAHSRAAAYSGRRSAAET